MEIWGESENLTRGSHQRVSIICDAQVSPKCRYIWTKEWHTVIRDREAGDGKDLCLYCSREKASGINNPNCRYPSLKENIFEDIEDEAQAYLLGWVASDAGISKGAIALAIHRRDRAILYDLREILGADLPLAPRKKGKQVALTISRKKTVADACRHLGINPGKKSSTVQFPVLKTDALTWAFIRGLFDGDGSIRDPHKKVSTPQCKISSGSPNMCKDLANFVKIPCRIYDGGVDFEGTNALDFLARIYDGAAMGLQRKRELYLDWSTWVRQLGGPGQSGGDVLFRWARLHPDGVAPSKSKASDSGYDITIIGERDSDSNQRVRFYRTGIRVSCLHGWYFDLVPRSSITKTGYILANSIGVIDRSYRGELLVALIKIDPEAAELTFPIRIAQIIPRPVIHLDFEEVDDLDETTRGPDGFGSTG